MTQEQLADQAGVSVRGLRDLERGRSRAPRGRTASLLADALQLTGAEREDFLACAGAFREPVRTAPPTPRELPPAINDLTGRDAELTRLSMMATGGRTSGPVIGVLHGLTGSGKTSLAVNAAHQVRHGFPCGQLFVDLQGAAATPMSPMAALERFLRSLGLPAARIPATLAERTACYRTLTQERRLLVVLDDAADEQQVRPLLPPGAGCLVLITSWLPLTGLDSVNRLHLPALGPAAAGALLHAVVGERAVAEPEATAELTRLCGRLPAALRIAGNLLAGRPSWSVARLVHRLRDPGQRLSALTAGDQSIRAALATSYGRLAPVTATVLLRCAQLRHADFSVGAAATATELPETVTAAALDHLADAGLLATAGELYRFPELVGLYAEERLRTERRGR